MWLFGKKEQREPEKKPPQQFQPVKDETQEPQPSLFTIRHPNALPTGGFNMSQGDSSDIQAATSQIIKQMGGNLITGNFSQLFNVSKPVAMSKNLSLLESIANELLFCSSFLEKVGEGNPIEQIIYVMTFLIAGLHTNANIVHCRAPLDPLLGETIQLVKPDGTQFYAEHINTNPQQTRFQLIGQNYKLQGLHYLDLSISKTCNTFYGRPQSKYTLTDKNGTIYSIKSPDLVVGGLVMGERVLNFEGTAVVSCEKTKLQLDAYFNYNEDGMFKAISSLFVKKEPSKISDKIDLVLFKKQIHPDTKKDVLIQLCTGEGSWLEGISFNNKIYWKIGDEEIQWSKCSIDNALLSDSSYRQDMILMGEEKFEQAQSAKLELERNDQYLMGLRKNYQPLKEELKQDPSSKDAEAKSEQ